VPIAFDRTSGNDPKSNLPQYATHPDAAYLKASVLVAELLQLIRSTPQSYGTPPPPYTHNPDEVPPSYSPSESLAYARAQATESAPCAPSEKTSQESAHIPGNAAMVDTIDFGDTSTVQTRGKGAKKAAKKAQQAKWLDSGDEGGGKNGDDGDGDGGNTGGGDGGSGAGGNDDGGGGDDNNDDWDFGGKKNKKNKKTKKQEEEEKKKQEEEEQKKKDDEKAAAAGSGGNFLNWADDANEANMDEDWAGFTATKSKDKKKKGKKVNSPLYITRFISDFMYRIRMQQLLLLQIHMRLQRSTK
jgi:hypothetical protein